MVRIYSIWYLIIFGYLLHYSIEYTHITVPLNTNERCQFGYKSFPFFLSFFSFYFFISFSFSFGVLCVCVRLYVKVCKLHIDAYLFNSMALHVMLMITISKNSGVRLVQAWTNVYAAGENETVFFFTVTSLLLSVQCVCLPCIFISSFVFFFFVSFTLSLFRHQLISKLMAIHLNQCVWLKKKPIRMGKRCVCWCWFLSCFCFSVLLESVDWQKKELAHNFDFFV